MIRIPFPLVGLIILASCSKLAPFKPETFQTIEGNQAIKLVTRDELEIRERGANIICKYTDENGSLRVTANIMGTTQALYYQRTPEGLRGSDGTVLYSDGGLLVRREELRRQREVEEATRRAEQQRRNELRTESMKETRTIARAKVRNNDEPPGEATVTDVNINIRLTEFGKMIDETYWYGSILAINDDTPTQMFITYGNGMRTRWIWSVGEIEGNKLKAALRPAWERWRQKYADAIKRDQDQ